MGLTARRPTQVTLSQVGHSGDLRLDPHYHLLTPVVASLQHGITRGWRITPPQFPRISNGLNLPQTAYQLEQAEAEDVQPYLYASVGALSLYALRAERCTPLQSPERYKYRDSIDAAAAQPNEVLITRSGTPGIAWPAGILKANGPKIIPSGFVIRVQCDPQHLLPEYLAAVLNHPLWRVWSSSFASGKRQRNLSQEHLAQLIVPLIALPLQEQIAQHYVTTLNTISGMLDDNQQFQDVCDDVLLNGLRTAQPRFRPPIFSADTVRLSHAGRSDVLRLDARFHNAAVQRTVSFLDSVPTSRLGSMLFGDLIKGGSPEILEVDSDEMTSRVVATVSLQGGSVVASLTKPTTDEAVIRAGSRALRLHDVLVTLDGDGSIGKAAVFAGEYDAVTDSHVAILRLKQPECALALACFLNSSLGQAQFYLHTSGSTGQTQISKQDFLSFRIPVDVLDHAQMIGAHYSAALGEFERLPATVAREMANQGARTTLYLLDSDALGENGRSILAESADPQQLAGLLNLVDAKSFW